MAELKCVFCESVVKPEQDYRRVIGWERSRSQGGTNALRLRKQLEQWACRWCIEKMVKGIAVGQEALM